MHLLMMNFEILGRFDEILCKIPVFDAVVFNFGWLSYINLVCPCVKIIEEKTEYVCCLLLRCVRRCGTVS